jgi:hypothetical protein
VQQSPFYFCVPAYRQTGSVEAFGENEYAGMEAHSKTQHPFRSAGTLEIVAEGAAPKFEPSGFWEASPGKESYRMRKEFSDPFPAF